MPHVHGSPALTLAVAAALTAACAGSNAGPNTGSRTRSATPVTTPTLDPGPTCVPPLPPNGQPCLPLAPADRRVDLTPPTFSNPMSITNPLHPTSGTKQVVYGGQVDGSVFRTEFTQLTEPKSIRWNGRTIRAVTMQYLALHDGRIAEVALDWFAQADDGSVWYLGEDVFNYEDGAVADTEGTWVAGKQGAPAAMIMPARPKPGDVYRPENAPGLVFEEVVVKATDRTVQGPRGPVRGAIVVRELHQDATVEDKVFAPGYGEFSTGSGSELEAVSLAMPIDARPRPAPPSLAPLTAAAAAVHKAVRGGVPGSRTVAALQHAWARHRTTGVPPLLDSQMSRDIASLAAAVRDRSREEVRGATLRIAQNELDLRLQYSDVATIDRARLGLWLRQVAVDAAGGDRAGVRGDIASLGWTWQRVRHTVPPTARAGAEADLKTLRAAADRGDLAAAARPSRALLATTG